MAIEREVESSLTCLFVDSFIHLTNQKIKGNFVRIFQLTSQLLSYNKRKLTVLNDFCN